LFLIKLSPLSLTLVSGAGEGEVVSKKLGEEERGAQG